MMAKVLAGDAKPLPPSALPSAQYYAPTLGQYFANGFKRGVWWPRTSGVRIELHQPALERDCLAAVRQLPVEDQILRD